MEEWVMLGSGRNHEATWAFMVSEMRSLFRVLPRGVASSDLLLKGSLWLAWKLAATVMEQLPRARETVEAGRSGQMIDMS